MSLAMETAADPAAVHEDDPRRSWAAVFALARFEARDLLRYIPVLVTLLLYVGYTAWTLFRTEDGMDAFPALQDIDRATQTGPLLLGIALFVCVNRCALRSRRRGTDRQFDVLVMEPWRRTVAHVLSVVPFAALTALVVLGEFTWQALRPGAVGHGSPAELAVGPLYVLLCGALGVLLARLVPTMFAAPILRDRLLRSPCSSPRARTTPSGPLAVAGRQRGQQRHAAVGPRRPPRRLARPLSDRAGPAGGPGCAVLASGGRAWPVKAGAAGALALTLAGAVGQSGGVSAELTAARERATGLPAEGADLREQGASTYCAFPEWTGRAGTWAGVVDRVQSLAAARPPSSSCSYGSGSTPATDSAATRRSTRHHTAPGDRRHAVGRQPRPRVRGRRRLCAGRRGPRRRAANCATGGW